MPVSEVLRSLNEKTPYKLYTMSWTQGDKIGRLSNASKIEEKSVVEESGGWEKGVEVRCGPRARPVSPGLWYFRARCDSKHITPCF